jgi:hypothetical protein
LQVGAETEKMKSLFGIEVTLPDIKLPLFVQEQAEKIKNKLR